MRLCALLVLLVSVGCASSGRHLATVSVVSAHATAAAVQDTADAILCPPNTPDTPVCLSPEERKAVAAKLSPAFGLTGQLAQLVKDWPVTAPVPQAILLMLPQISALLNEAFGLLPGTAQDRVIALTGGVQ